MIVVVAMKWREASACSDRLDRHEELVAIAHIASGIFELNRTFPQVEYRYIRHRTNLQ
jgi:hypothetical protein